MPPDYEVETFWKAYLATLPERHPHRSLNTPAAWSFGNSSEMADELGVLVQHGTKTATCSLLWEHDTDGQPLPQVGELSIILDGVGLPLCLIETVQVEIKPYGLVDESFAAAEAKATVPWSTGEMPTGATSPLTALPLDARLTRTPRWSVSASACCTKYSRPPKLLPD